MRIDDYINGRIVIRQRDLAYVRYSWWEEWWSPSKKIDPGIVQIKMPKWESHFLKGLSLNPTDFERRINEAKLFKPGSTEVYDIREYYVFTGNVGTEEYKMQRAAAEKRVRRVLVLWKAVEDSAQVYIHSYASAKGSCAVSPCRHDGDKAADYLGGRLGKALDDYSRGVAEGMRETLAQVLGGKGGNEKKLEALKRKLANALDNQDGKSGFGWMSAGLFSFTLASMQQSLEMTSGVDTAVYKGSVSRELDKLDEELKELPEKTAPMNRNYMAGIKQAGDFFTPSLSRDPNYAAAYLARTENGDLDDLKDALLDAFLGKGKMKESHAGILGAVLHEIGSQDPIIVLQSFGQRILNATSGVVFKSVTILGIATGSASVLVACIGLMLTGLFFAYLVPFIPVIYWCKALISWIFMVVEAMVAAPFWVCSHAMPEGDGFAGQHARRGYMMLLDIVARPALLVIGAVFAVFTAQVCGLAIYKLFNIWFSVQAESGTFGVMADICYAVIVMSVLYFVFYTVFTKGVIYMPEHVLQWCGGVGAGGMRDENEGTRAILDLNRVATGEIRKTVGAIKLPSISGK